MQGADARPHENLIHNPTPRGSQYSNISRVLTSGSCSARSPERTMSMHSSMRGGLDRAATWPQSTSSRHKDRLTTPSADIPERFPSPAIAAEQSTTLHASKNGNINDILPFDNIDDNPEEHFLSPVHMYEYEDWADDSSDEEGDEVEWDAGITDFALYDDDRKRASASGTSLPSRWDELRSNQASALQRSVDRSRAATADLPDLIPDNSPDLRDDLEIGEQQGDLSTSPTVVPRIAIISPDGSRRWQSFQHHRHTDDNSEDEDEEDDEEDGLFFSLHPKDSQHAKQAQQQQERLFYRPRLQRPGLRHGRTLSGQAHVWKRPSLYIPSVREDSEGEVIAERQAAADSMDDYEEHSAVRSASLRGREWGR